MEIPGISVIDGATAPDRLLMGNTGASIGAHFSFVCEPFCVVCSEGVDYRWCFFLLFLFSSSFAGFFPRIGRMLTWKEEGKACRIRLYVYASLGSGTVPGFRHFYRVRSFFFFSSRFLVFASRWEGMGWNVDESGGRGSLGVTGKKRNTFEHVYVASFSPLVLLAESRPD